ncbi:MAG: hypothetical protein J0H74_21935 [Chitinophagaceae bacterium]|nr:hypothetical protein [Chitinophagaceae bacterium]
MANDAKKISLHVSFEQTPQQEISLLGFLFYCDGRFLQAQPVRENLLEFTLGDAAGATNAPVNPSELRVFLAPATDKRIASVKSIEALEQYKPYEPLLTPSAEGNFSILPIPSLITQFWPFCSCRVTGKVSKWFFVDGIWEDRPVCKARVHICNIDAIWYWIYKIPDYIIAKVPEVILNPKEIIKFPIPQPDPPPFATSRAALEQTKSIFRTFSEEQRQMDAISALPELSADIRQTLASGNLNRIRETIAANYAIFHPWFCLWPWWWPWFYHRRELAVVYTDAAGRFDKQVSYWCTGDKPDIYIWVEYLIGGVWTTVYEPPIPCHTFWDYACGSPINIHITDPRVAGGCCCDCPIPGDEVWVRAVGSTSISHINQASYTQAPPGQSVAYNRIGLTDAAAIYDPSFLPTAVGDFKRPFGGSPTFIVGFGNNLPNNGVYYYRWSYKKVKDAGLINVIDSYKPLQPSAGITSKGYEFTYVDSHGDTQFGSNTVKLGPFTIGANDNLYIIPTERPDMAPFSVPEANPQWTEPSYRNYSITFNSDDLKDASNMKGDGLYEFKLELFDKTGALLTNIPKTTFKVPEYSNAGFSVNAPDALLDLPSPLSTVTSGFNILIRVDNSACSADIYTVLVNHTSSSPDCCGFVSYKPGGVEQPLDLTFQAAHPNNFAVFEFLVERGTCGYVDIAGASGMVIDSADGYILGGGGVYDKSFTPAQLLGTCYNSGVGKGAFAETLSVAAMATDGTYRLTAKDNGDVAAFALEP